MGENEKQTMALALPSEITVLAGQAPRQARLERQVTGVMYLDALHNRKIVELETPKYDKALKQAELLKTKLIARAKRLVVGLKSDEKSMAVKDALEEIDVAVRCIPEFVDIDLDVENMNVVQYHWVVKGSDDDRYSTTLTGGTLSLDPTPEMKAMLEKYWEARKEIKRSKDAIIIAEDHLNQRANRMSDAQGALALKTMGEDEKEEVRQVYTQMVDGGASPEKLLEAARKD